MYHWLYLQRTWFSVPTRRLAFWRAVAKVQVVLFEQLLCHQRCYPVLTKCVPLLDVWLSSSSGRRVAMPCQEILKHTYIDGIDFVHAAQESWNNLIWKRDPDTYPQRRMEYASHNCQGRMTQHCHRRVCCKRNNTTRGSFLIWLIQMVAIGKWLYMYLVGQLLPSVSSRHNQGVCQSSFIIMHFLRNDTGCTRVMNTCRKCQY